MNLLNTILSDPINKWVFDHSTGNTYLVGGYIRDLIIGRKSGDRDFVVEGDIEKLAGDMGRELKGTVINISRYNIFRVVINKKEFIDFTPLGGNIKGNLKKRDFTVNSIAWNPVNGLIDPLDGSRDIQSKLIKITTPKSIYDDALRCLRAFRIAAELDFNIDRETLLICEKHSNNLSIIAKERKTAEIIKLLNTNNAVSRLEVMLKHNVLSKVIDLNDIILQYNIYTIYKLDLYIKNVKLKNPTGYKSLNIKGILNYKVSQGMTGYSLLRMAILTYGDKDEKIEVSGLRLNNSITKRIRAIHSTLSDSEGKLTKYKLYRILKEAAICTDEAALILSMNRNDFKLEYVRRAKSLKKFMKDNIVNGNDIQSEINISEGVEIGKIKEDIYRKWFIGELDSREDIISFLKSNPGSNLT